MIFLGNSTQGKFRCYIMGIHCSGIQFPLVIWKKKLLVIVLGLGLIKPRFKLFQCANYMIRIRYLIATVITDGKFFSKVVVFFLEQLFPPSLVTE